MSTASSSTGVPEMDIATLVRQKEQELRDINEQRIHQYEELIRKQTHDMETLRTRLRTLKDDFTYNYQLLQDRDKELETLETINTKLTKDYQDSLQEKDKLQNQLIYSQSLNETHIVKFTHLEKFYTTEIQRIKDTVELTRHQQQEELQQYQDQIRQLKQELTIQQTNHEEEITTIRKQLTEAADAAMDILGKERRKKEDQLSQALKTAEERANENAKTVDDLTHKYNQLSLRFHTLQTTATETEQECQVLRQQLIQQRTEMSETILVSKKERDEARAARTALIEEYEKRMQEAMDNIRQAETEFRQQRQRYEHQIEVQHSQHQQTTAETVKHMEERMTSIANRLREKEDNIQQLTLALQENQTYANEYRQRYEKAEADLLDKERNTVQQESETVTKIVRLETELQVVVDRCRYLQEQLDTKAESEAEARATTNILNEQIVNLQSEIAVLRKNQTENITNPKIRNERNGEATESVAPTTTGNNVSPLSIEPDTPSNNISLMKDAVNLSIIETSGTPPLLSAQIGTSVLDQLGFIEKEKGLMESEKVRLQIALQKATEDSLQSSLRIQNLEEELRLYKQQIELLEQQPQVDHDYHSIREIQQLQSEVESYRRHCQDLEEKCSTFRTVIADMRHNMEDLQNQIQENNQINDQSAVNDKESGDDSVSKQLKKQLRDAQAYRSSAEVMLASLVTERDDLLQSNARFEEYIGILQEQTTFTSNGGDVHSKELLFLRQQLKKYSETISLQRIDLRKVHQDLARLSGEQVVSPSIATASSVDLDHLMKENFKLKQDLQAKSEEVLQLLVERDRLLDLSNRLRSSLAKAAGPSSVSNHDTLSNKLFDSSSHVAVPIGRLAQLEDALARVTAQNVHLRHDVHRLLDNERNRTNISFETSVPEKINESMNGTEANLSTLPSPEVVDQGLVGTSATISRRVGSVPLPRNVSKVDNVKPEKSSTKTANKDTAAEEGIAALAKSKSRSMSGAVKLRNYAEDLVRENK